MTRMTSLRMTCFALMLLAQIAASSFVATPATQQTLERRDGQHDFDFLLGNWKLENRRVDYPLPDSHRWTAFGGTSSAHALWNGRAVLEVVRFDEPGHPIDGLSLHFYDGRSRLWSQYWATARSGLLPVPNVGALDAAGTGVLVDRENYEGKPVMSRYRWTHTRNTAHWEQAFSSDGGRTWETNWTTDYTRE